MFDRADEFRGLLEPVFEALSLNLSSNQVALLARHYSLLVRWNNRINLTTIKDIHGIVERHFGESLFVAKRLENFGGTLIDVGSGAGFPGVPVGVLCSNVEVTLIESNTKKAIFLEEVVRSVGNVGVFNGRVEEFTQVSDWATVRAVKPEQIIVSLHKLAKNVVFMVSFRQVAGLLEYPFWKWQAPEPLPWSPQRVLLVGRWTEENSDVPRET